MGSGSIPEHGGMPLPIVPALDSWSSFLRRLRWLPFGLATVLSLWVAAGGTRPRKPFAWDLTLSRQSLAESLGKGPHYKSTALVFLVATVAVGPGRPLAAFALTMLVGVGWELAETTAVRHHARTADLAPDLLAALPCLAILIGFRSWRPLFSRDGPTLGGEPAENQVPGPVAGDSRD